MAERLILEGGSRPRKRKATADSWTAKKERAFLGALVDSCNVKLAAKTAGVSASAIYVRRSNNASFRAAWDRALAEGYVRLEMMLMERALHGVDKAVVARNGTTTVMREYSDRTALALLRMHRENASIAGDAVDDEEYREACERIIGKLERLRERDLPGEDKVETKAAEDRPTLIRNALRAQRRRDRT